LSSSSQIPENLEGLTEKVGTIGLQVIRKNRCGGAKKRARKAKFAETSIGESGGCQSRSALGDQLQALQKPCSSGAHYGRGPVSAEQKSPESKGHPKAQVNESGRPGALRRTDKLKGPNRLGNLVMPGPLGRASGWLFFYD
jgi:hypothetical protein